MHKNYSDLKKHQHKKIHVGNSVKLLKEIFWQEWIDGVSASVNNIWLKYKQSILKQSNTMSTFSW